MDLNALGVEMRKQLDAKGRAREAALPISRQVIRNCANGIRAVHRGDRAEASRLLQQARGLLDEVSEALAEHPDVRYAGFVHDAQKEYAEGRITESLVFGSAFPTPNDCNVAVAAYLNGMGEAVGELRRHILDLMRQGKLERSEELLQSMDEIYYLLTSMDYPDAMTGGLRRTTDVARSIMERTRGDLSTTIIQFGLKKALEDHGDRLSSI